MLMSIYLSCGVDGFWKLTSNDRYFLDMFCFLYLILLACNRYTQLLAVMVFIQIQACISTFHAFPGLAVEIQSCQPTPIPC